MSIREIECELGRSDKIVQYLISGRVFCDGSPEKCYGDFNGNGCTNSSVTSWGVVSLSKIA